MTSDYQKERLSAPAPFPYYQGPIELEMGSMIIITGSTGFIVSESWRSNLPPSLSVTNA